MAKYKNGGIQLPLSSMKKENGCCVYGLVCPITNEIRYVGHTANPNERYYGHVSAPRKKKQSLRDSWIHLMREKNLFPGIVVFGWFKGREKAFEYEKQLIIKTSVHTFLLNTNHNKTKRYRPYYSVSG